MGQYHIICNVDKGEFLYPHKFGQGLKFAEFASSGDGIMYGLAVLLANNLGGGGGDLRTDSGLAGSWAGDRIVIVGDYCGSEFVPKEFRGTVENFYDFAVNHYTDISDEIIRVIKESDKNSRLGNLDMSRGGWR
jgi:hypothetical protein